MWTEHANDLSVLCYFAKIAIICDNSTTAVEQFHSSVTLVLHDSRRAHVGDDFLEDVLRVHQNGPIEEEFHGESIIPAWYPRLLLTMAGQRTSDIVSSVANLIPN